MSTSYDFDLTDRDFHRAPCSTYRRMRAAGPAVRTSYGSWVVTHFADVSALLRDSRLRVDFPTDPRWVERHGGAHSTTVSDGRHWMLLSEDLGHRRMRRAFQRFFTPQAVERRADLVAGIVESVLRDLRPGEPFDVVSQLAEPVVTLAMCDLLGLPSTDRVRYAAWTSDISRMTDPVPGPGVRARVETAMTEFRAHLEALAREDRLSGIAADLLYDNGAPAESTAGILANLVMLAMAGTDTTVSQITLAVRALLAHPGELARVTEDPGLAARGVSEFARFDGPVHLVTRRAAVPLRIADTAVPAGAKVMLCLGAANHDLARYPDAHQLRLDRADIAPLPFGDGAHYCLGAHLGRLVTGATVSALFRRRGFLAAARPLEHLVWRRSVVARRPESLPVVLG
ncbi:cytochrome P450 [Streptomyces prunicolor]